MVPQHLFLLTQTDVPALAGGDGPDLTRYLLVCGFLIALIIALGWGFKRIAGGAIRGRGAKRALSTVDVLPLGGKQRVAVVRCYDRSFLIGVGDKDVRLLAELDRESTETAEAPELTTLPNAAGAGAPQVIGKTAGQFLDALKKRMGDPGAAAAVQATNEVERAPAAMPNGSTKNKPVRRKTAGAKRGTPKLPGGGVIG